jgi:hypothetical protein
MGLLVQIVQCNVHFVYKDYSGSKEIVTGEIFLVFQSSKNDSAPGEISALRSFLPLDSEL